MSGKWFYMFVRRASDGEDHYLVDDRPPVKDVSGVYTHPEDPTYRYLAPFRNNVGSRFIEQKE